MCVRNSDAIFGLFLTHISHFGHNNILNFKNDDGTPVRDFSSVEEMNETMVDNWNRVVKKGDKVYHLGDVFFGSKENFQKLWPRLNGSKRLVVGNHDDIKWLSQGGFFQKVQMWRIFSDWKLILSHVPLREDQFRYNERKDNGDPNGFLNVHGHIHARPSPEGPYKCVCVEQPGVNYTPVNIEDLRS